MENNTTPMYNKVNGVIAAIVIMIFAYLSLMRIDKFLKIKAVDDCANASRYERTIPAEQAKVTAPVMDQYKSCLKDKGY